MVWVNMTTEYLREEDLNTGKDKDYRYMATSDLLNELNKESFKADQDLESKLTNIVLQQLEDASGDVSGSAVKWADW
ncbi:Cullin-associated NEDD8-dissociated protein 1 [Hordeum vulgare]|nr:Cullin-associated NEDD8-dissociated protein 1 [Hordeum vulgare]